MPATLLVAGKYMAVFRRDLMGAALFRKFCQIPSRKNLGFGDFFLVDVFKIDAII